VNKLALASLLLLTPLHSQTPQPARKRVLAWGDATTAYQHDSISHALATIERLGRESGAFDAYIRTDSQLITKQPVPAPARNTRNLDYFSYTTTAKASWGPTRATTRSSSGPNSPR
jgi:hypothetical protein